jgi:NADH dehydrogenase (ubiquinone) 1 alpha subcomplex subunit 9
MKGRIQFVAKRTLSSANSFGVTFGPGGRSSNSGITATIFGGYGFVGRYYASELGETSRNF